MPEQNGEAVVAQTETVTPEVAAKWLETMVDNRRVTSDVVMRYAKAMRDGLWLQDGSPLRFNIEGKLIDGQHRLWAVIESGVTSDFMVARNIQKDAFLVMDTGRPRSFSDVLLIRHPGLPNVLQVAATVRALHKLDAGNALTSILGSRGRGIPHATLLDFYERNVDRIARATTWGDRMYAAFPKVLPASSWSTLADILCGIDNEDAEFFLNHLASGRDLAEDSPIYAMRRILLEQLAQKDRNGSDLVGLAIKAWNAFRDGTPVQRLMLRLGGAKPESYPVAR